MKITIYQLTVADASSDDSSFTVCSKSEHPTKAEGMNAFREANNNTFCGRVRVQLKEVELILEDDGDWNVSEDAVKTVAEQTHE